MYCVQKIEISKCRYPDLYAYLDEYAHKAKNLRNAALFRVRNHLSAQGKSTLTQNEQSVEDEIALAVSSGSLAPGAVLNYYALEKLLRVTKNPDFFSGLPKQTAQGVVKQVCREMKSFFAARHAWKKDASLFTGCPKMPGYSRGDVVSFVFTNQECRIRTSGKRTKLKFPLTDLTLRLKALPDDTVLKEVRCMPQVGRYVLALVFQTADVLVSGNVMPYAAAIDPGVDNLAAIASNAGVPALLCKGGAVKSANQWFNRQMARLRGELMRGHDPKTYRIPVTHRMENLSRNRRNFLLDYFHKLGKRIVSWCIQNRIGTLVFGQTKLWKQESSIGHKNNQTFTAIPHYELMRILQYLCDRAGIRFITQEESYTSKASALDGDDVPLFHKGDTVPKSFSGKRISRGLYKASDGTIVNADLNGAANILRKALPDAFSRTDIKEAITSIQTIRYSDLYQSKRTRGIPGTVAA